MFDFPPRPGHDVLGRKVDDYHYSEVLQCDVERPGDVRRMSVFLPQGQVTVVHRRVNVGDHVYYRLDLNGEDTLHCYGRVEDFRDGRIVYVTGFSEAAPDGEFGSLLLDQCMCHVTADEFERARAAGWPAPATILEPV